MQNQDTQVHTIFKNNEVGNGQSLRRALESQGFDVMDPKRAPVPLREVPDMCDGLQEYSPSDLEISHFP